MAIAQLTALHCCMGDDFFKQRRTRENRQPEPGKHRETTRAKCWKSKEGAHIAWLWHEVQELGKKRNQLISVRSHAMNAAARSVGKETKPLSLSPAALTFTTLFEDKVLGAFGSTLGSTIVALYASSSLCEGSNASSCHQRIPESGRRELERAWVLSWRERRGEGGD